MAEREAAWSGGRIPGAVDLPGRVDPGVQGTVRRAAIIDVQCEVRGNLGERTPGWIRVGNLRRRRYVSRTVDERHASRVRGSSLGTLWSRIALQTHQEPASLYDLSAKQ
uniref:Uncharacterized protein n=1 Tax=Cacopsylla melanoneura TaxID=428564 RepID=A0A8D8UVI7_9HEMI